LTVAQLEQWELLGDGRWGLDRRVLLAVVEHHLRLAWDRSCRVLRHGLPDLDFLHELEERATVSVSWHVAPRVVDEDGDEWWEREGGARAGGVYLNMMMPSMKVVQRAVPEQMAKEMRWASLAEMRWDTRDEEADHHLGGGAGSRALLAVVVKG
jgi:hypothetical protein